MNSDERRVARTEKTGQRGRALNIETRKTAECTKGVGGGTQGVLELGKHGKE
jgi:hypothetical protein